MSYRVLSYRCKKVHGRKYACVGLPDGSGGRRDILLGRYGTKESRIEYSRGIAEWQAADRRVPKPPGSHRKWMLSNHPASAHRSHGRGPVKGRLLP